MSFISFLFKVEFVCLALFTLISNGNVIIDKKVTKLPKNCISSN